MARQSLSRGVAKDPPDTQNRRLGRSAWVVHARLGLLVRASRSRCDAMTAISERDVGARGGTPRSHVVAAGARPARDQVRDAQRTRILAAMARVASDHGVQSASVERVVDLAGVSRKTFYVLYEDRHDCLLAAIEHTIVLAHARAQAAYIAAESWVDSVRAALFALLVFFDEEPGLARLCVVQALAGNAPTLARRGHVIDQIARIIDGGRREAAGAQPPPLTAHAIVGGALSVLHTRLLENEPQTLVDLLNPLMSMIVLPYLGPEGATREFSRSAPVPPPTPVERSDDSSPLNGLEMRLTYRTLMVLAVIARQPGLSNRQIGERAGIRDQGQISKMLARLARLGMTENGKCPAAGAANAWRLTAKGESIESRFRREAGRVST
jgi:AcrR family transcriptional regulator/DNA-binding MarR family transcriptional regulator